MSVGGGVACKMIKGYYFVIGNFSASERERAKQSEASEAKRSEASEHVIAKEISRSVFIRDIV